MDLDNTTFGGLGYRVKQAAKKSIHSGETTVEKFEYDGKVFFPGSQQGSVTLSDCGVTRDFEMLAFLHDDRLGSSDSSLSVHMRTLGMYTSHTIFVSPDSSLFGVVTLALGKGC